MSDPDEDTAEHRIVFDDQDDVGEPVTIDVPPRGAQHVA